MSWTTNPNDPLHTWNGYDIAVHLMPNNGMDQNQIELLYRTSGADNPWQSMGAADGAVWSGDMVSEMNAMGGFKAWRASMTAMINTRLASWAATIHPVETTVDPATFEEYQVWLPSNIRWTDAPDKPSISQT